MRGLWLEGYHYYTVVSDYCVSDLGFYSQHHTHTHI